MNCSSHYLRDLLPKESARLGRFLSKNFCEPLKCTWSQCVSCVTKTKECARSAMRGCGLDIQRLSFPSTVVAMRKAIALYQQNPRVSVREAHKAET